MANGNVTKGQGGIVKPLTAVEKRNIKAMEDTLAGQSETVDYLHSTFCQVGIPRSKTLAKTFERRVGNASVLLQAGSLWDGQKGAWIEQPLPYGVRPRMILLFLTAQAIRTRSRDIEVGASMHDFMHRVGLTSTTSEDYKATQAQLNAFAASTISLGYTHNYQSVTSTSTAIEKTTIAFEQIGERQRQLFPNIITLRQEFFDSIQEHAVPLDRNAISGVRVSALAMDIYLWLAYRLPKIRQSDKLVLSWSQLREQFGQEYGEARDFKAAYKTALQRALSVYPRARVTSHYGGLTFLPSPSPIAPTTPILRG